MKCVNCGRPLLPDTPVCPYCEARDERRTENKRERRKVFVTLCFCALVLALIAAGVLMFMPGNTLKRDMETAESSYAIALLCSENPVESGDERYQLILLDAAEDIGNRYAEEICGYNQTVTALSQLYCAENAVVQDKTMQVWSKVESKRFFQLLTHNREEQGLVPITLDDDLVLAAESSADEYEAAGMDYLGNLERLVEMLLPGRTGVEGVMLYESVNAQDALVRYEAESEEGEKLRLYSNDITHAGVDAAYNEETGKWSFFTLISP